MTKDEWISRCAARFVSRSDLGDIRAREYAEACYDNSGAEDFADDPEGAADEDMSCWSD